MPDEPSIPIKRMDEVEKNTGKQSPVVKVEAKVWRGDWEYLPGKAFRAIKNFFKRSK